MTINIDNRQGKAFNFSDIAEYGGEIWVIFAVSKQNSEIFRLAPAFLQQLTSDSVPVVSKQLGQMWLLPGVELSIHSTDLADRLASDDSFKIFRNVDEELVAAYEIDDKELDLLDRMSHVAEVIETKSHFSESPTPPKWADCAVDSLDPAALQAILYWKHDRRRAFQIDWSEGQLKLSQLYRDSIALPEDRTVPLETRFGVVEFDKDGCAKVSSEKVYDMCVTLDLRFLLDKFQNFQSGGVGAKANRLLSRVIDEFFPNRNIHIAGNSASARNSKRNSASGAAPVPPSGEPAQKYIEGVGLSRLHEGRVAIDWNITEEEEATITWLPPKVKVPSVDGTLREIGAHFAKAPNDATDPSTVDFDSAELSHPTLRIDQCASVTCTAEGNSWQVEIVLASSQPLAAKS